jgi:hypothetical protein
LTTKLWQIRALIAERVQTLNISDWEDVREEVCAHLELGLSKGETELDIVTRLIWLERQNNLGAIEKAVAAALDRERGLLTRQARVLQWKPPLRSSARF